MEGSGHGATGDGHRPIVVVGIGRPRFGDDALGLLAAKALEEPLAGIAQVVADPGSGWAAVQEAEGRDLLVLVDAAEARGALPAGRWMRMRYPDPALAACGLRDTHTAGVEAMLEIAALAGCLPPETWVYAMAGERFAPETDLSPSTAAGLGPLVEQIVMDVRAWVEGPAG